MGNHPLRHMTMKKLLILLLVFDVIANNGSNFPPCRKICRILRLSL